MTAAPIPEQPGLPYRLGRHLNHDPRSRGFPAPAARTIRDVAWRTYGPRLDQGQLGSCTGNALVGALMTRPNYRSTRRLTEADAVRAYTRATVIDPFEGAYPPTDTGSDGLSVCKAGVEFGWLVGYDHAFGLSHLLDALMSGAVMVGTVWHEGMFSPDGRGRLTVTGDIVGGHEYVITGRSGHWLRILNSWGLPWGDRGYAYIRDTALGDLLEQQGDATVPRAA